MKSARRDVFISYSHKDQAEAAQDLAAWLDKHGLTCWLDYEELRAGSEYDKQILEAIRACRVVLALVSTGSVRSKYVPFEVSAAAGLNRAIILAFMEDMRMEVLERPFNAKASGIQYRKLYSQTNPQGERDLLLRDLLEHCAAHRRRQRVRILTSASLLFLAGLMGWILRPEGRPSPTAQVLIDGPARIGAERDLAGAAPRTSVNPNWIPIDRSVNSLRPERPVLALEVDGLRFGTNAWIQLEPESALTSRDAYCVRTYTLTPGYLYIFQQDAASKIQWLFPKNETWPASEGANPQPAFAEITVPANPLTGLRLDETVGTERIIAVLSEKPFLELEARLRRGNIEPLLAPDFGLIAAKGAAGVKTVGLAHATQGDARPADLLLPALRQAKEGAGNWVVLYREFRHVRP